MPPNENSWIKQLLTWHGHAQGGVRVPFNSGGGNPLRGTSVGIIETSLVRRMRALARQIAGGGQSPRWVFLVGGPGNGKSETVEQFIRSLDDELGCAGKLVGMCSQSFAPNPLVPWAVEIESRSAPDLPQSFADRVGRLIIVQDASASDSPAEDAATKLADYMVDLATHPVPVPVFVCCVNRGLLARSLSTAYTRWRCNEAITLIKAIIAATALGKDALTERRPKCWPLELQDTIIPSGTVACWPMDMESLLLPATHGGPEISVLGQILEAAVEPSNWEISGRCGDCDGSQYCPFRQNAIWLRDPAARAALQSILRRGELATGQRWNFRDMFSLTAQLLVGEWHEFGSYDHPCKWVHALVPDCSAGPHDACRALEAAFQLLQRLYVHSLFPVPPREMSKTAYDAARKHGCRLTLTANKCAAQSAASPVRTHVQSLLRHTLAPILDPSLLSPHVPDHKIGAVEDAYAQSVAQGNREWAKQAPLAAVEEVFCTQMQSAENEWDPLGPEPARSGMALKCLRLFCSSCAKRSIAVRLGMHANEDYLASYERAIRCEQALDDLTTELGSLLGNGGFSFNALESFGQPQDENDWILTLHGSTLPMDPIVVAPNSTPELPAHDYPFISLANNQIALTFDLYAALRLRKAGCAGSSLPASVRAAIDRIRHLHAGALCRNKPAFATRGADYRVLPEGKIQITRQNNPPAYSPV